MTQFQIGHDFPPLAPIFKDVPLDDDLGAGIQVGYGLMGYRGKTWSIKYKGDEINLMRPDGDGPVNAIEVVIIKSPNHLSKTWYESGWVEGSNSAPDCASSNGVVPDANVPKRQNDICATCRWDAFGSRPPIPGQAPTKGKACADNKRLAIVPLSDLRNEPLGGPMLLRIPAATLADISAYAAFLKQLGYPYYSVATKISFDPKESYPKFVFKVMRPLSNEEGEIVMDHRNGAMVARICDGDATMVPSPKPSNVVQLQAPAPAAAPPPSAAAQAAATQAAAFGGVPPKSTSTPVQSAPPPTNSTGVASLDDALDKELEGLLG